MTPQWKICIFSKNRAAQLELLLRSFKTFFADFELADVAVLVDVEKGSEFSTGYELVQRLFPSVSLFSQEKEKHREQIQGLLKSSDAKYFSFFADDLVFVNPFSIEDREFNLLIQRTDIAALSLRLFPEVTYSQPLDRGNAVPPLDRENTYRWKYPQWLRRVKGIRRLLPWGDWAWPYILDGNVYRLVEFREYFSSFPRVPNIGKLEPLLTQNLPKPPRVLIYPQSKVVSVAMTTVQEGSPYPSLNESAEKINLRFLTGERLDGEPYRAWKRQSCHIAAPAYWKAESKRKSG